ncbi:Arm domain-containing protein [Salix suchowensis]|nr:Arm domain-containing protein [Salix suchowensis]
MGPLVCHLGNKNVDIATEAAMALGKFACPENFNCSEHSKAIIEFNGVPPLMRLLRSGDEAQLQGLVLLCYLALNAGTSKALVQARALNALERTARYVLAQHPEMKGLVDKAIHLIRYQAGATPSRHSSFSEDTPASGLGWFTACNLISLCFCLRLRLLLDIVPPL